MSCLLDIYAVEKVDKSHVFQWEGKTVIDHIKKDVCCVFGWDGDREVVYLSLKDDTVIVDYTGVEAWFMDRRSEAAVAEDLVGMSLPQARGVRVTLHGGFDWNDVAWWDLRAAPCSPPFAKGFVGASEEALLWRGSLTECVEEVFGGGSSVENPGPCLVDTVGVGMVQDADLAGARGAVARASFSFVCQAP